MAIHSTTQDNFYVHNFFNIRKLVSLTFMHIRKMTRIIRIICHIKVCTGEPFQNVNYYAIMRKNLINFCSFFSELKHQTVIAEKFDDAFEILDFFWLLLELQIPKAVQNSNTSGARLH